jgi:hypothetical protein
MDRRLKAITAIAFAGAMMLATVGSTFAADKAMVRVLHASPDAPAVDIYVNGSKALSDVPFKGLSDYVALDAGTYKLEVKVAGSDTVVIGTDATVEAGMKYTVAAIGKLAVFVDDGAIEAGKTKLRVIHLSPDAPAVDVALKGQAPADALVKNLSFPDATGYLVVAPGTYDLEVRLAGTETVALDLAGTAVDGDTNYTVFAVGLAAADAPAEQKLTVVVGVDATASDTMSPPPTSTVGSTVPGGPAVPVAALFMGLLAAGGVLLALNRRFATSRNR